MIQNKEDHQEDEKEEKEEHGRGNDGDNINGKSYKKRKTNIKGNSKNNSSKDELQILFSDDESLLIYKLKTQKSIKTKQRNNKNTHLRKK